ncbi:MAG TPA: ribosome silencing factor [Chloroflexia bacterium]|nr:ribosome silencing factor [Chloroflexia bacterium]
MIRPHVLAQEPRPQKPSVDPDALGRQIAQLAADKKAEDIVMLDIRALSIISDYFVICTGTSDRQVRAIARDIDEQLKKQHGLDPTHLEGMTDASWVLMDYGGVIVHIFDPAMRDYYKLEKLWAEAPRVLVIQ